MKRPSTKAFLVYASTCSVLALIVFVTTQWRHVHEGRAGTGKEVQKKKEAHKNKCPQLLLIVIFNNVFYKNIPYLRELYGPAFQDNLVYYGPEAAPELNVTECTGFRNGFLQHRCVAMAMKRFPDFDGYMWIGDDAVLNIPRLFLSTDLNKVWTMRLDQGWPLGPKVAIFQPYPRRPKWYWHDQWIGMTQVRRAYSKMPGRFRERMASALGLEASVATAWSDAGYIPEKYRLEFVALAKVMKFVTFECAFPTTLRLMVTNVSQEVVEFEGVYLAQYEKVWPPNSPILHPVKFSVEQNRRKIKEWLGKATELYNAEIGGVKDTARTSNLLCHKQLMQSSPKPVK